MGWDKNQIRLRVVVSYNGVELQRKEYKVGESYQTVLSSQAHPSGQNFAAEVTLLHGSTVLSQKRVNCVLRYSDGIGSEWVEDEDAVMRVRMHKNCSTNDGAATLGLTVYVK
jgi:hypothetical protein